MPIVTEGRIVWYVLDEIQREPVIRPALVVQAWEREVDNGVVNLLVFLDGTNDHARMLAYGHSSGFVCWRIQVAYDADRHLGTWHWPPRV